MLLILYHPAIERIDCRDCCRRAYDMETGEPRTYGAARGVVRYYDQGHIAPCRQGWKCPKESPELAHLHILSPRNKRILRAYLHYRATNFAGAIVDDLARYSYAVLDGIFREHDRAELARKLTNGLGDLFVAALKR